MKKLKYIMIMALSILFIGSPSAVYAAADSAGEITKESNTYYYNLDQEGENETVTVNVVKKPYAEQNYFDYETTVTVNDKVVYQKTDKHVWINPIKVMVVDTNTKDKQMELLVLEGISDEAWVTDMTHIYYYRFSQGETIYMQDLVPLYRQSFANIYELHGMTDENYLTTNGKGELYARLCLRVKNYNYVHIKQKLRLSNGKFKVSASKSYTVLDGKNMPFVQCKKLKVYKKPGGKQVKFTVKKGKKVYVCGLYRKSKKKIYLKVKDRVKRTGYINPSHSSTFADGTQHT